MIVPALSAKFRLRAGDRNRFFNLDVELRLERGVLVLFGPSGVGKTLTVQALAGLRKPDGGYVRVKQRALYDGDRGVFISAHQRRIGYVPQHQSLFPFCDVFANVAFGLARDRRKQNDPYVLSLLEELDIAHLASSPISSLSGGETKRVALARALAVQPDLMLLDEPFASIDRRGARGLLAMLRQSLERHDTPAVFVTHDAEDAVAIGDNLVRFERGKTVEQGQPESMLRAHLGAGADGIGVDG
ncbi:MAG: ATP-binding cassette domain-containing protein [Candidatus Binatia bacterium]